MTIKQLAAQIAKIEGKKSQARIGDIAEILSILSDMAWEKLGLDDSPLETLVKNGQKRSKRKKK